MIGGGGEFHFQVLGKLIELQHVVAVVVRDGDAKPNVLDAYAPESQKCFEPTVESTVAPAQIIIDGREPFDADANPDFWKLFCKSQDLIDLIAGGGNNDARGLAEADFHDFGEISPHKGFAASDIHEFQLGKNLQFLWADFALNFGRVAPDVAHLALHAAAIGGNDGDVAGQRGRGSWGRCFHSVGSVSGEEETIPQVWGNSLV